MRNGLNIIDSDMHIMEPLDLWDRYMEVRFKDRWTATGDSLEKMMRRC